MSRHDCNYNKLVSKTIGCKRDGRYISYHSQSMEQKEMLKGLKDFDACITSLKELQICVHILKYKTCVYLIYREKKVLYWFLSTIL